MKTPLDQACLAEPLTCDGAMGTQLIQRGMSPGECGMRWNAERPDDIRAVHQDYRDAGCRLIITNSFGGTRSMLERHGEGGHTAEWNRLAAKIAADAAGPDGWVLGDVGPFGDFLEPMGETTTEELEAIFREQIEALAAGGADAILVETMSDPAELTVGVKTARQVTDLPVVATYAFQDSGGEFRTMMGTTVADAIRAACDAGASIVGSNCGTDLSLENYLKLGEQIVAAAGDIPTILQPNAGAPRNADGGVVYDATPEDMAELARKLRELGIHIIGGCCGTSPAHLAAMARV
ncbi:homocysteine S-methyltransferase family protein [Haloferula sp. A504]|uniref:homocysteine S-methyltransferase family protein n=1 Tax=Haloferula sp. A504 TaxID=3373601 RepID=UPI0031C65A23|nr:homocysteine S-methyltransferase family protein [Verrucomicrobiaceae bacterium E54]